MTALGFLLGIPAGYHAHRRKRLRAVIRRRTVRHSFASSLVRCWDTARWTVKHKRAQMTDDPVTLPIDCKHCGATLTVHMDRWHADARLRQHYLCPVCGKRDEGTFEGRVVRVIRRLDR